MIKAKNLQEAVLLDTQHLVLSEILFADTYVRLNICKIICFVRFRLEMRN